MRKILPDRAVHVEEVVLFWQHASDACNSGLQGNNLTVDCNNASFNYLTSICPDGNQTTKGTQVALAPLAMTPRPPTTTTGTSTSAAPTTT